MRRQLHRTGPRGGDNPALAGVVPGQPWPRADAGGAGHVQHHAIDAGQLARLHARHGLAHREVDGLHVDREQAVELVLGQTFQRLRQVPDASVVDEDVDGAEVVFGSVKHQLGVCRQAHVHTQRTCCRADRGF